MDAATEEEFMGSSYINNQMMIVKRKRTKRLRKSSSCLSLVATSSSSSDVGGGGGGESDVISSSLEEDEDMANCLILLAQSGCQRQDEKEEAKMGKNGSSRRFNEMVATTGKVGIYVYECKTCNRSFPSFQALGGHRASHKKPKTMVFEDQKVKNVDHHEEQEHEDEGQFRKIQSIAKKAATQNVANTVKKIHECSICGLEFLSGQALGGHMRRHRNIPTSNKGGITMNIVDTSTSTTTETSSSDGGQRAKIIRILDLNLPAPPEDDGDHDSKFQYLGNQQQQQHPFSSSPALVDCHY